MKISKEGQNLRKLIAATDIEIRQETQRSAALRAELRVAEIRIIVLRQKHDELIACLGDSPAKTDDQTEQATPGPTKRRGRKKQTVMDDPPPAGPGNGSDKTTWYLCDTCKEHFKRPAIVNNKEVCPECGSANFAPGVQAPE